jgi:membrane protein
MAIRSLHDARQFVEDFVWHDRSAGPDEPGWLGSLKDAGFRALRITYAVIRDLAEGSLSLRAMSLVYYTVIAFVPLLALTFAVIKGLGVHNAMEPVLLGVLEPFLGEYSVEITNNIVGFVDNVRVDVLSVVSLGILLYTVLTMMQRIELSFNYIWSVTQARTLANRVSEYLFAVIVSPLLILLSIGIASYVNTNLFVRLLDSVSFGASFLHAVGYLTPYLFMSLAFAFAFSFIPNTRVQFKSAFYGGVVTTVAWKGMAWVFQNFITEYSANAVIYAAFFALILLMLFIYLGWLMLLIGSTVAYYHQNPAKTYSGRTPLRLSLRMQEELGLTVAYLVVKRFKEGDEPWSVDQLQAHTRLSTTMVESALSILLDVGFISATDSMPKRYLPVHSVDSITLPELRKKLRERAVDKPDARSFCDEQRQIRKFLDQSEQLLEREFCETTFYGLSHDETDDQDKDENDEPAGKMT